jgi:hypothetical protein
MKPVGGSPHWHSAFEGMSDTAVLQQMAAALMRQYVAPMGSIERALAKAAYNVAKDEVEYRAYLYVVARIEEIRAEEGPDV